MAKPFKVDIRAISKLQDGELYTLQEIADIAQTTYSTMYLAISNGDLKHEEIERTGQGKQTCHGVRGEDARAWLLSKTSKSEALAGTTESKVYEFMLSFQAKHGKPPIIKDIGAGIGMSPAYVKKSLAILQDRGYVQELVYGAFFEAIPDDQRQRPNPLLGETDGAHCTCGIALVWPQHVTPEAVAALAEKATFMHPRSWQDAIDRAADIISDMLTPDGERCAMCAKGR